MPRRAERLVRSAGDRILRFPDLGRDAMLLMLTWAAGIVDAISYLGLGRVFTAMMTGNTVLLALAVSEGESMAVMRSVLALAGFSAGAAAGALLVIDSDERSQWAASVTHSLAFARLPLRRLAVVSY